MSSTLTDGAMTPQPPPPGPVGPGSLGDRITTPGAAAAQRRFSWVFLGIFLIAGSILGFVFWTASQNDRIPVLVAGADIEAGAVIDRADVKLVAVSADTGVDLLTREDQDLVVGGRARVHIPADTPLLAQMTVAEGSIPEGFDVVGAALRAGEYPASSLNLGDEVFLLQVEADGVDRQEAEELGSATIWAIEPLVEQSEPRMFLSLLVPRDQRLVVANAIDQQRLRISLVGGG